MVDQEIGHAVAEMAFRPAGPKPLEHDRVAAVLQRLRIDPARIDWPEIRMCSPTRLPSLSSPPTIFAIVIG